MVTAPESGTTRMHLVGRKDAFERFLFTESQPQRPGNSSTPCQSPRCWEHAKRNSWQQDESKVRCLHGASRTTSALAVCSALVAELADRKQSRDLLSETRSLLVQKQVLHGAFLDRDRAGPKVIMNLLPDTLTAFGDAAAESGTGGSTYLLAGVLASSLVAGSVLLARQNSESSAGSQDEKSLIPSRIVRVTDAALAGVGLWSIISALSKLQERYFDAQHPLFMPSMLASGIIFFAAPAPPPPTPFLFGTLYSATVSLAVFGLMKKFLNKIAADGAAAGALLISYKLSGVIFPPAVGLFGKLADQATLWKDVEYLFFPWLAGHASVYGVAMVFSYLRSYVRAQLAKGELHRLAEGSDTELRKAFNHYDTSGDGALDANELKLALRTAIGMDLEIRDCEQLIAAADRNGTGTIDFEEFKNICRQQL
eukprot:TRINITY_DN32765_c0_g1_i1.p1 TRINITY_DN32765_c0_g1~~TRINITY_DN32765_c0_g1_i1.p1  ORF type:complete len:425 (-),score=53.78 TRINITY_DN32765_c0_g1_i1:120-1394(-)